MATQRATQATTTEAAGDMGQDQKLQDRCPRGAPHNEATGGVKKDVLAFGGPAMSTTDWLRQCLKETMEKREAPQRLDDVSFEGVARYIASGKCRNIITMAGAGISTSAGIPDYRTPGTGLFDLMKDKYQISDASDLFSLDHFLKDPKPFFERSKRFFEIPLKPTPCHYFVRLLHEKGLLLRHYTQNIDTLERLAGLPADKVVEAHGSYYTSHCMDCDKEYDFDWMEERVMREEGFIPRCEEEDCTGVVKPDIVMFGESLSPRFSITQEEDTLQCDLLIVMGTALAVQPFASMTSKVKTSTPRLYINLDRGSTCSKHPMNALMFGASFDFDAEDNYRDVFKQEKCDTAVYEMADILGWKDELHKLVEKEHKRFDEEGTAKGKLPPTVTESTELPAHESSKSDDRREEVGDTDTGASSKTSATSPWVASSKTGSSSRQSGGKKDGRVAGNAKPATTTAAAGNSGSGGKDSAARSVAKGSAPASRKGMQTASSGRK